MLHRNLTLSPVTSSIETSSCCFHTKDLSSLFKRCKLSFVNLKQQNLLKSILNLRTLRLFDNFLIAAKDADIKIIKKVKCPGIKDG